MPSSFSIDGLSGLTTPESSVPNVFIVQTDRVEPLRCDANTPELVFVCEGHAEAAYLDGEFKVVEKDNFLLALPGDLVSLSAGAGTTLLVCRIRSDRQLYDGLQLATLSYYRSRVDHPVHTLPVNEGLQTFLDGFIPFIKRGFSSQLYYDGKIMELLYVMRECYDKSDLAALFYHLLGRELAFKNFVFTTIPRAASVGDLARMANMSTTGFRSKFQKVMGQSPSQMLNRYKADMIRRELLYTDTPLKEISEKYGFGSIHVFTRFCNRNLGHPPGVLRKSSRSQGE